LEAKISTGSESCLFSFARPGFLLWQVTNLWTRAIKESLEPLGITQVQFVVLAGLIWMTEDESTAPVTQVMLARLTKIDVMTLSQVVRILEREGYVKRLAHPGDSRAKVMILTNSGKKIVSRAIPLVESADKEFFASLGGGAKMFMTSLSHLQTKPAR